MLGWSMTPRCRARDFSPAMEMAWSTAWPYGPETPPTVVLRHDNGTQFTSEHYREVARRLGIKLSRTRYRNPDGNALVERIFLSLKQEEVWPQDFASFAEAQAAVTHWILDYNTERPHQSLKYRTPPRSGRRHWDQRNPQLHDRLPRPVIGCGHRVGPHILRLRRPVCMSSVVMSPEMMTIWMSLHEARFYLLQIH
jgi:transposase InsO family protein